MFFLKYHAHQCVNSDMFNISQKNHIKSNNIRSTLIYEKRKNWSKRRKINKGKENEEKNERIFGYSRLAFLKLWVVSFQFINNIF